MSRYVFWIPTPRGSLRTQQLRSCKLSAGAFKPVQDDALRESIRVLGFDIHKTLQSLLFTLPGSAWECWEEGFDGPGHSLDSTSVSTLSRLCPREELHSSIQQFTGRKKKEGLAWKYYISSLLSLSRTFYLIHFESLLLTLLGNRKCVLRELRCILLCDTYE